MCYAPIPRRLTKAKATIADIEALADQVAPEIAQAVMASIEATGEAMDLDALAAALAKGDVEGVITMLDTAMAAQEGTIKGALQNAAATGGAFAAASIHPPIRGVTFAFNRLNPSLIQWIDTYSHDLIRELNDKTREGVRQALRVGMEGGHNPIKQARQIKQIVGLTERQSAAVHNFRRELETMHQRRTGGGYKIGAKIDRVNGRQVFRQGKGGKPADGITERRLRDFRFDGQLKAAIENKKPLTPAQIDKMVAGYTRKYLKYRSETIARTESMRTLNMGAQDAWRQAIETGKVPEIGVRRFWRVAKDERTCPVCKPIPKMNEKGVPFATPFATPKGPMLLGPVHPDCLPAGTLVTAGSRITAAAARWYEGEMVVIRTASGKELPGTPNHPVLGDRGWIGIGSLRKGDRVISRPGFDHSADNVNDQQTPVPIEQIAATLLQSREVTTVEVPLSAEHFHGDAADGDVAIIGSDSRLLGEDDTLLFEQGHEAAFMVADVARVGLPSDSALDTLRNGPRDAAHGVMGGADLGGSSICRHGLPLHGFGSTPTADRDALPGNSLGERSARDADLFCQIVDGSTGPVFTDEVVDVRRFPFSGHVYSLETVQGCYTANGIVSHNCRCHVFIRLLEPQEYAAHGIGHNGGPALGGTTT